MTAHKTNKLNRNAPVHLPWCKIERRITREKKTEGEIEQRTQEKEGEEVKEQVEYVHKNPGEARKGQRTAKRRQALRWKRIKQRSKSDGEGRLEVTVDLLFLVRSNCT